MVKIFTDVSQQTIVITATISAATTLVAFYSLVRRMLTLRELKNYKSTQTQLNLIGLCSSTASIFVYTIGIIITGTFSISVTGIGLWIGISRVLEGVALTLIALASFYRLWRVSVRDRKSRAAKLFNAANIVTVTILVVHIVTLIWALFWGNFYVHFAINMIFHAWVLILDVLSCMRLILLAFPAKNTIAIAENEETQRQKLKRELLILFCILWLADFISGSMYTATYIAPSDNQEILNTIAHCILVFHTVSSLAILDRLRDGLFRSQMQARSASRASDKRANSKSVTELSEVNWEDGPHDEMPSADA